jgi:hypothetical protein
MRNHLYAGIMNTVSKLLHYFVSERFTIFGVQAGFLFLEMKMKMKKKESRRAFQGF